MNPDTNQFEALQSQLDAADDPAAKARALDAKISALLRPDGTPVPDHWTVLSVDEVVEVKGYRFKVVYINENTLVMEPAGPVIVGEDGP